MAQTPSIRTVRLVEEVAQERALRLKAEAQMGGLRSANVRLQATVLRLKAQLVQDAAAKKMNPG